MGEHLNKRSQHRACRFDGFSFAEAILVHAIFRHVQNCQNVFPTGRPFPKSPLHPSAIALFPGPPMSRVLIDSARRISKMLRLKRGFSQLERYYAQLVSGFQKAHPGQELSLEVWSFSEDGRRDIFDKMQKRIDVPARWVGPEEICAMLKSLQAAAGEISVERDDLGAVLALFRTLESGSKGSEGALQK